MPLIQLMKNQILTLNLLPVARYSAFTGCYDGDGSSGLFSIEKIMEKMCHNPAILFRIKDRGFIREGYKADICLLDPNRSWTVSKDNLLYKCGWSPFEGTHSAAEL